MSPTNSKKHVKKVSTIKDWKAPFMNRFSALASQNADLLSTKGGDANALTQFSRYHHLPSPMAGVVAHPKEVSQIQEIVRWAGPRHINVMARGLGSGVMQGIFADHDTLILDLSNLDAIIDMDKISGHVTVESGINGWALEQVLNNQGFTIGHFPQSIALSSVGGWVATKSIGQYSTRYGGIEHMVRQIQVVTGHGDLYTVGHLSPRRSAGPELLPLFIGSEGTLGIISKVTLKIWPVPTAEEGLAWSFPTFATGLDVMQKWIQAGLLPSAIRLYDEAESARTFAQVGGAVIIALFQGAPEMVRAAQDVARHLAIPSGDILDNSIVDRWLATRNDVSAWAPLLQQGFLVDTIEVSGTWSRLKTIYQLVIQDAGLVPGLLAITGHSSHAYSDGANLYFTFIAQPAMPKDAPSLYREIWQAVMTATRNAGGSISHHHGIGRIRQPWLIQERESELPLLEQVRHVFDPYDIFNRGALWPQ